MDLGLPKQELNIAPHSLGAVPGQMGMWLPTETSSVLSHCSKLIFPQVAEPEMGSDVVTPCSALYSRDRRALHRIWL